MKSVNPILLRPSTEPLELAEQCVFMSLHVTLTPQSLLPYLVVVLSAPADALMQRPYQSHPCIRASESSIEPPPVEHPTTDVASTLPSRKFPRVNVKPEFPNIVRQCQHRTATVNKLAQIRNRECLDR